MSETDNATAPPTLIRATAHVDPEGSLVKSGMLLADAVIAAFDAADRVNVSLEGLRGASSSYFNVFLRRIDEGCGLAEISNHIHIQFGSNVQKMVFDRSFESVRRGL